MFSLQLPGPAAVRGDPSCPLLSLPVTLAEELQCRAQTRTVRKLQGKRLGQLQPLPQTLRAWALLQLDGPPRACRAASARLAGAARNKSFREKVRGAAGVLCGPAGGLCGPVSRGQVGFISEKRKAGDGGAALVRWSRQDHSLIRGHPHHGRPQSRGRGQGCHGPDMTTVSCVAILITGGPSPGGGAGVAKLS